MSDKRIWERFEFVAKDRKKAGALVTGKEYQGKYVAFGGIGSSKIIASGRSVNSVTQRARKQGVEVPVIVFVPKDDTSYIY